MTIFVSEEMEKDQTRNFNSAKDKNTYCARNLRGIVLLRCYFEIHHCKSKIVYSSDFKIKEILSVLEEK